MATSSDDKASDPNQIFEGTLPLRLTSVVVRGYGRGSNDLGIPTANLSRDEIKFNLENASFDDLPTGTLKRLFHPYDELWGKWDLSDS